jgi:hypothetical protein
MLKGWSYEDMRASRVRGESERKLKEWFYLVHPSILRSARQLGLVREQPGRPEGPPNLYLLEIF